LTENLSFKEHFEFVVKRASQRLHFLRFVKNFISKSELWNIYFSLIRSRLEYESQLYIHLLKIISKNLDRIQTRAHKIICGNNQCECKILTLEQRRILLAKRLFNNTKSKDHFLNLYFPHTTKHGRLNIPTFNTNRRRNWRKTRSGVSA
jgi:hypothetical protein